MVRLGTPPKNHKAESGPATHSSSVHIASGKSGTGGGRTAGRRTVPRLPAPPQWPHRRASPAGRSPARSRRRWPSSFRHSRSVPGETAIPSARRRSWTECRRALVPEPVFDSTGMNCGATTPATLAGMHPHELATAFLSFTGSPSTQTTPSSSARRSTPSRPQPWRTRDEAGGARRPLPPTGWPSRRTPLRGAAAALAPPLRRRRKGAAGSCRGRGGRQRHGTSARPDRGTRPGREGVPVGTVCRARRGACQSACAPSPGR